jgi:hypothetical protein
MVLPLPDIPETESTPLVRHLLDIIRQQQDRLQQLEDENEKGVGHLFDLHLFVPLTPDRVDLPGKWAAWAR